MNYIQNSKAIIIFANNETHRVSVDDPKYLSLTKVFELPKDQQEQAALEIIFDGTVETIDFTELEKLGFRSTVEDGVLTLYDAQGTIVAKPITQKIVSMHEDGFDVSNIGRFWQNLKHNPSKNSIDQLMDFLSYKELPITTDGYIVAYKGVDNNGYSMHGNLDTEVLQGEVNRTNGKILNKVGDVIEVRRNNVNDDPSVHCSTGLHVGSYNYADSFGTRLLTVKINP